MKIAFIGGGNMGEAMLAAVLEDGLAKPEAIWVSDVSLARRRALVQQYGVAAMAGNLEAVSGKEIVVLAVKPQNLSEVMAKIGGRLGSGQAVLSIVAGAKIDTLSKGLKHGAIARAMPNTPAQIGEGMSVWTATPQVTEEQKGLVGAILAAMGVEVYVDDSLVAPVVYTAAHEPTHGPYVGVHLVASDPPDVAAIVAPPRFANH